MTHQKTVEYLQSLLKELVTLNQETEWAEFKHNSIKPEDLGEYISALANSAALLGKPFAYLIWGGLKTLTMILLAQILTRLLPTINNKS